MTLTVKVGHLTEIGFKRRNKSYTVMFKSLENVWVINILCFFQSVMLINFFLLHHGILMMFTF